MNKTGIEWTDYSKGWIEALIDGEGSLSLIKANRPKFRAGCTYCAILNIANKDIKLVEKAKIIIGFGAIFQNKKTKVYNLNISAIGCRYFLPKIVLITKERQRILLLKALKIINRRCGRSKLPRTDKEIQNLENIYLQMKRLNGNRIWRKKCSEPK